MKIFNLFKKPSPSSCKEKENSSCNLEMQYSKNIVKVLGLGCISCKTLYVKLQKLIEELNLDVKLIYITDLKLIASYNITTMPILIINEKVICYGRIPNDEKLKEFVLNNIKK